MKLLTRSLVVLALSVVLLGVASLPVMAQSTLSEQQRQLIRANCLTIKNSLNQLKATDALLRVNRGQVYEAMSGRLMDRFNSRLNSNRLDAQGLTAITQSYDTRLNTFRRDYEDYARQLDAAIRIDCESDPDAFHFAIDNARTKRQQLHEDVKMLHAHIADYRAGVIDFQTNFERVAGEE
ncbi:hypothetical protein CL689_01165 [Candidatus Saccharibacteria bacterium]|nr:hypothetical protein [Candidatus Saccharibacteria bacterium]MBQ68660.1 hypothetical protein [Candidatus Saccharibacteria bacterium]|tara:strand:+ start:58 stop:597 length:540 start_codon:yes stop_codon:yes gene_type:complete